MKCESYIVIYNKERHAHLFPFLAGLTNNYEIVKRDILKEESLPSVERAYTQVRREATWFGILNQSAIEDTLIGSGFSAKIRITTSYIGEAHAARGIGKYWSEYAKKLFGTPSREDRPKQSEEKSNLRCSNCGMNCHTKEACFRLVGYPD